MADISREDGATALIRSRVRPGPLMSPGFMLSVVEGSEPNPTFAIDDCASRRVLVGQSPACHVRLTDKTVSRRHAAFELEGGALRILDLGSSNGTFVSGVRVRDAYLRSGELITLGATTLRVDIDVTPRVVAASQETRFGRTLGASPEMRRLYPVFEKLAASDVPVLIEGETGTGKEVLAESIHDASARRDGPFVVFDCTTVSPQLVEAELFGHERGAFTGAVTERVGLFEEANKGTLFIDEIGDLEVGLQAKLLRAIEKHEVKRVGGSKWAHVDVRILAATRRDLDREVQARRFRDDLFFRLAVARVDLPPLRNRQGDVALLTRCFWAILGGDEAALPPDLVQRFEEYAWPGNVRELHNAVARQLALGDVVLGREKPASSAPRADYIDQVLATDLALPRARQQVTLELERRYVAKMLEAHGGNVSRAAAACGISRRYFQMLRAKKP
ncbi:MAG: sigma 54-interacting transcriptional regulator [Myxococcales bacterium]|nr:sigma 54-interacting transcriptional regulator [Myxococcales bacterium]